MFCAACVPENVLFCLRRVYDELVLKELKFTARTVVNEYDGDNSYGTKFLKQTAQTAMRLLASIATTILNIASQKDP